ncbi:hypothetical protein Ahy_A02g009292 [Arachis hypogaea]|uniref:GDSL esterase/lipase n=1 Tax=Arachis hypogaea TaxID=3818 RepID=A0A445EGU4_ARAHY|nr:hypothetical protein Ahy_A02g009292 [Arachis hypogaea]
MDDMNLSQYLAKSLAIVNHGSNDYINNYLLCYYSRLRSLVDELNTQYSGSSIFVYGNTYAALMQIIQNPIAYGKKCP